MPLRRHSRIASHQSKKFTEKRHKRALTAAGLFILCAVSWAFALSRFSSLEYFSIESVRVYGADPDITLAVQSAANDAIQGSYLNMFSKSNSFIYSKKALTAAVVSASPRIISADVSRDGWQTLVVSVTEKTPAAIVCADLPDFDDNGALKSDDDCYAADASGLIFKKISADAAAAGPPEIIRYYIPSLPDGSSVIGLYATSTAEFKALQSFMAGVKPVGIRPEAILMKDGGEYELYADSPLIVVYLNDKASLPAELSDLTAFWSHMVALSAAAGGEPQSFEYIDLRYGSNVFYR
jgi:cell division septal protein FtsQ